jgi:hypothetical protein
MSGRRAAGKHEPVSAAPSEDAFGGVTGPAGPTGRSVRRQGRQARRRRTMKIAGLATAGVVAVAGSGTTYLYFHLMGNVKTSKLYDGSNQAAAVGVEKPDAFGRTPLNILLIGSDTRDNATDAHLGGDAGPGARMRTWRCWCTCPRTAATSP